MTLLFFDGFTDASVVPKPEWNSNWNSVAGRNGQTNGAASVTTVTRTLTLPSSAATCIHGWAETYSSSLGATNQFMAMKDSAGTTQLVLFVNTSGFIEIRRTSATGTLLGTSSGHTPIALNVWHSIQWKATLHTSTGIVTVRLNDVQVLSLTGQATSSLISNVVTIDYHGLSSVSIDDMWVCDAVDATATQGQPNNDFLGDLRVMQHYPTGAGDSTQFSATGAAANWDAVDEVPPSTSEFVSDSTTGHRDLYAMTDLTGTISNVYAVRECIYASKSDAGPALLKPVIKENSTVTSDTGQGLSTTAAAVHGSVKYVKPSNSGLWTGSDINAMQVGVEVG